MSLTNTWAVSANSKANTHSVTGTATGSTILTTYGTSVGIYTNGGTSFTQSTTSLTTGSTWGSITVSDNGNYVYVTTSGSCPSPVIASTSAGATNTWVNSAVSTTANGNWDAIAVSSTGQYVIAIANSGNPCVSYTGLVYGSSNYGASFTPPGAQQNLPYSAVGMDSSGYYSYIATSNGFILSLTNYGASFAIGLSGSIPWNALAVSDSGQYVCASGAATGALYCSNNFGIANSFTAATISAGTNTFTGVAMDASGQYVAAATNGIGIFLSNNYGVTFTQSNQATGNIVAITANDAFTQIVAVDSSSNLIYGTVVVPTSSPTFHPTATPTALHPTASPTRYPTAYPTIMPTAPTVQPTPTPPITYNGMGVYVGVPISCGLIFCILWYCFLKFCLAPKAKEQLNSQYGNVNIAVGSVNTMPLRSLSGAVKADAI